MFSYQEKCALDYIFILQLSNSTRMKAQKACANRFLVFPPHVFHCRKITWTAFRKTNKPWKILTFLTCCCFFPPLSSTHTFSVDQVRLSPASGGNGPLSTCYWQANLLSSKSLIQHSNKVINKWYVQDNCLHSLRKLTWL